MNEWDLLWSHLVLDLVPLTSKRRLNFQVRDFMGLNCLETPQTEHTYIYNHWISTRFCIENLERTALHVFFTAGFLLEAACSLFNVPM
jgi:hypothetical protein